ncbi:MAG: hypothetical protein AB4911_15345 [Oscillochloridaceae bacterium umkhey_bin13]
MSKTMTRRQVLISGMRLASLVAPTTLLIGCGRTTQATPPPSASLDPTIAPTAVVDVMETRLRKELIDASRAASAGGQWTALELNNLIDAMGEDSLKRACKTLAIPPNAVEAYASTTAMKREIRTVMLDASRFLPGGDREKILYHKDVLQPTARNLDLDGD